MQGEAATTAAEIAAAGTMEDQVGNMRTSSFSHPWFLILVLGVKYHFRHVKGAIRRCT